MLRSTSIILSALIVILSTDFEQILRSPVLIEHYLEHRRSTPQLEVLDFLTLHYGAACDSDDDQSADESLPYKSPMTDGIWNMTSAFLPTVSVQSKLDTYRILYTPRWQLHFSDSPCQDIFEPPRS